MSREQKTIVQYSDFRPTSHDVKGLGLPNQQDWFVLPYIRTRDSTPPAWNRILRRLKPAKAAGEVEIHKFNHWAVGWYEIIIASPKSGILSHYKK